MRAFLHIVALAALPAWAAAETCPPAPDHQTAVRALIEQAQTAGTEAEGRAIGQRMWELWADAPDEQAQAILDRGMSRRSGYDFLGALEEFDRLIAYCPDYAEGYNQRAFVHFLRQDFARALPDLDRAIALSDTHVAALSGKALTLLGLGRIDEARAALEQALALNPWIPERGLAQPGMPLTPPGKEL